MNSDRDELTVFSNPQVKDPVCGMKFDPQRAAGKWDYMGQTYYFCNPGCLEKFRRNPAEYLIIEKPPQKGEKRAAGFYTCPMHPEVIQDSAGACPICGMAL